MWCWFACHGKDDVSTVLRNFVVWFDVQECFQFIGIVSSPGDSEGVVFWDEVSVYMSAGRAEMFTDAWEVCGQIMSVDCLVFDVACDKYFGHVDWYYPVVRFWFVSFDWGDRGHDVVVGVGTEVSYAP